MNMQSYEQMQRHFCLHR